MKEGPSSREWHVRPDCVRRRETPAAPCEMRGDKGLARFLGAREPKLPSPIRIHCGIAVESAKFREPPAGNYANRCDPTAFRGDIVTVRPWMVDIRRAAPGEIRGALMPAMRHIPPANTSVSEDVHGRGGEVRSKGT